MRSRIALLIVVAVMCGCGDSSLSSKTHTCSMVWLRRDLDSYLENWEYICVQTGRSFATVRISKGKNELWETYVSGRAYGDYITREQAQKRAEYMLAETGLGKYDDREVAK